MIIWLCWMTPCHVFAEGVEDWRGVRFTRTPFTLGRNRIRAPHSARSPTLRRYRSEPGSYCGPFFRGPVSHNHTIFPFLCKAPMLTPLQIVVRHNEYRQCCWFCETKLLNIQPQEHLSNTCISVCPYKIDNLYQDHAFIPKTSTHKNMKMFSSRKIDPWTLTLAFSNAFAKQFEKTKCRFEFQLLSGHNKISSVWMIVMVFDYLWFLCYMSIHGMFYGFNLIQRTENYCQGS